MFPVERPGPRPDEFPLTLCCGEVPTSFIRILYDDVDRGHLGKALVYDSFVAMENEGNRYPFSKP